MRRMTRRTMLATLPTAGAFAAVAGSPQAAQQPAGKLKITKLVHHQCAPVRRELLFVEVHADGGIVGLGKATCAQRVDVVAAALRWLEPHPIGVDPTGIETHVNRIGYRFSRWNSGMIPRTALSAIEMAFWDIEGKLLGVPVRGPGLGINVNFADSRMVDKK